MRACVSPPQLKLSHIVQEAASMAQAASMALPPLANVSEPAVAARGLPAMPTQCAPCSTGLCVTGAPRSNDPHARKAETATAAGVRNDRSRERMEGQVIGTTKLKCASGINCGCGNGQKRMTLVPRQRQRIHHEAWWVQQMGFVTREGCPASTGQDDG